MITEANWNITNNSTNCTNVQEVQVNVGEKEFVCTVLNMDEDDHDEEVTITFAEVPPLEHNARVCKGKNILK